MQQIIRAVDLGRAVGALVLLALTPAASATGPPAPAGPEFQVNSQTLGWQVSPSVAMEPDGDFIVAWSNDFLSIAAQRYDSSGSPIGSEFQVNTYTSDYQNQTSVAVEDDGGFVVVWRSRNDLGYPNNEYSIQGQRFDGAANPVGSQFQVNALTTGLHFPSVAMDVDGDFVVVWGSRASFGSDTQWSVQGRRYDSTGSPQGSQFQVNTYTTSKQRMSSVAMDADGGFVVVWTSDGSFGSDTSGYSIQGQRYDSAGSPLGSEFQVNTYTHRHQLHPSVASDGDGNFVVAWHGVPSADGAGYNIQARRYDSAGAALGSEFLVNGYTSTPQLLSRVAVEPDGDFVVVWQSASSRNEPYFWSIRGRRFRGANPRENDFQVNTYTTGGYQVYPGLGLDPEGDFVVVWVSGGGSSGSDTSNSSILAQRYVQTSAVPSLSALGFASAALALLFGTAWALRRRA